MKPIDAFGVVVRTVGLLIILEVLWRVLLELETMLMPPFPSGAGNVSWSVVFLVTQLLVLLVGCVCFFRANMVVRLAYRSSPSDGGAG